LAVYRETESTFPEHNGITRANRERSWVAPDGPAEPEDLYVNRLRMLTSSSPLEVEQS
jgi:hypothetical protein